MRRFWASAALIVILVLPLASLATVPVAAAPPDAPLEAATESASSDSNAGADSEADPDAPSSMPKDVSAPVLDAADHLIENSAPQERVDSGAGSVRLRGLEAPVEFGQQREDQGSELRQDTDKEPDEPTDTGEERDTGDGPVSKSKRQEASRERDRTSQDIRVWPMPADSYTFTQQFGCVQQLGNLYFPGEGCPAHAPVIHTGVDLAAPEGTPFYAAASGWVTLAGFDRPTADANTRIIIQHDGRNEGFATDYLHWIPSYVEEGDYVRAGDPIGEVGSVGYSTGPHLHFSVTDLETGEHVDPVRWVPGEPGRDGYTGRMPNAQLRLPPGTTAGQPESADPSPPPPPTREDVPETPPGESGDGRARSERRSERKGEERRAEKRDESAGDTRRSDKKRSEKEGAASETSPDASAEEPKNTKKNERDRSRERERTRERNKDGSRSEKSDSGEDGRNRDNSEESTTGDRRRDRDTSDDSGDGDKEKRGKDTGGRDNRDNGGRSDSGGRGERSGSDEPTGGRQRENQDSGANGKRNGGGGKDRAQNVSSEGEATGGV